MVRYAPLLLAAFTLAGCGLDRAEAPSPPPVAAQVAAPDFDAVGTEPFWAVQVRQDRLRLSRPDHAEMIVAAPRAQARGETLVWTAEGMVVTITPGACSDGMSDNRYLYEAQVSVGTTVLNGCAYKAGERPTATPGS